MKKLNAKKCAACPLGPPDWQYICRRCKAKFTMPVPKGPSDEKGRVCPKCKSADIKRVDIVKSEACPPGG
jgi:DNA-directed RNA polymerase subunit RPC12/RpoP